MKLTKFDIGAEIISILTRGMYPDPRDAVREYIQNAIDAKAKNVDIKVRQNSVVIEDDGIGMDYTILRKALRIGVSDKRPGKDIGFMGIGIYSAFRLCDTLTIYTRKEGKLPQILEMDFKGMRTLLKNEREKRFNNEVESDDLTDLQTLLETYIKLPNENEIELEEYPVENGTRVELVGLHRELDDLLNKYDDLANYLQDVVPLRFDHNSFKWAKMIEDKIQEVCQSRNANFELVNINLQVGTKKSALYRPYTDDIFSNNNPFEPLFIEINNDTDFLGIAWGCLNSTRDRIKLPKNDAQGRNLRGFILKKQGFSIGKREDLSQYFGTSNTFYHRYSGEIIVVNNQILPNAARNDLESSDLKKKFLYQLQSKVAPQFIAVANAFQEEDKAKSELEKQGNLLKGILAKYNPNEDNYNVYLDQIKGLDDTIRVLKNKRGKLKNEEKKEASKLIESAEKLRREILTKFQELTTKKLKPKRRKSNKNTQNEVAKNLQNYNAQDITHKYESLLQLIGSLDIDYNSENQKLYELIDELFIQGIATSKTNYYQLLNQLKDRFENE